MQKEFQDKYDNVCRQQCLWKCANAAMLIRQQTKKKKTQTHKQTTKETQQTNKLAKKTQSNF